MYFLETLFDVKLSEQIEKHRATLDRENPQDFIDVYLLEADKNGEVILSFFRIVSVKSLTLFTTKIITVVLSPSSIIIIRFTTAMS